MKKSELNSKVKAEIKKTAREIESGLIAKLKSITGKLGKGTGQLEKAIEKGSKKLAKKIVKELTFDQPVVAVPAIAQKNKIEPVAETKPAQKAEPKKTADEKAKPTPVKEVKKANVPAPKPTQPVKKKV